jgi:hypothetical protein
MMKIVDELVGKMNKLWQLYDEVDFDEKDMVNDCKNSDIYLKHSQILYLQHLVRKFDL